MALKKATVKFVGVVMLICLLINMKSILGPVLETVDSRHGFPESKHLISETRRELKHSNSNTIVTLREKEDQESKHLISETRRELKHSNSNTIVTSRKREDTFMYDLIPSNWTMVAEDEKTLTTEKLNQKQEPMTRSPQPAKTVTDNKRISERFLFRQSLIRCDPDNHGKPAKRPAYTHAGNRRFQVCLLRKVASSFLGRYTRIMKRENGSHVEFYSDRTQRILVVREPYTRLVSGYLDRVLTNPDKVRLFSAQDVEKFWPKATPAEVQARCLCAVSFQQFAKYFIYFHKTGRRIDNHFKLMSSQCNPCQIKFDFIVHLETLDEDMSYIFKELKIGAFSSPPSHARGVYERPRMFEERLSGPNPCKSLCSVFRDLWWSYQATGFIARDFKFPVDGERCANISAETFSLVALDAIERSKNEFDKSLQKRQMMAELFLQLPLEDRIEIKSILARDFQLFGFDPQPADLFPELVKGVGE